MCEKSTNIISISRLILKIIKYFDRLVSQNTYPNKLFYRPQRSWGKVMFLHVSVILFKRWGVSQHALQVVSQHALQQVSRGLVSQQALQISRPTPRGKLRGLAWGSPGSNPGRPPGPHQGESPGPPDDYYCGVVRILLECILVIYIFTTAISQLVWTGSKAEHQRQRQRFL